MSNITGTVRAKITEPTDPKIYNVPVTLAATEYSQALSDHTNILMIRNRGLATLQIAFAPGDSGINFITIPPGSSYTESNLDYTGSIYFQASKASQVVEILEWS